jgi:hypothetical protein
VPGDLERLERDACELERLVALQERVRRVAAGDHAGRHEVGEVLEQRAFAFGHVDRGTRSLREVGNAAEVVPVAVRDQDGCAAGAGARELESKLGCVAAGVDNDCLWGVARGTNDVAVRADRAELVAVHDDAGARAHGRAESNEAFSASWLASPQCGRPGSVRRALWFRHTQPPPHCEPIGGGCTCLCRDCDRSAPCKTDAKR